MSPPNDERHKVTPSGSSLQPSCNDQPRGLVGLTEVITLGEVIVLDDLQVRHRLDPVKVRAYATAMKNGSVFPPLLFARLNGRLHLVDGFHRYAALNANGTDWCNGIVREVRSLEEARWLGAHANLRHGKQLNKREVREAFQAYIRAGQHREGQRKGQSKSYREIAEEMAGVSHVTIINWMRKDFPRLARAMGGFEGRGKGDPRRVSPCVVAARQAREAIELASRVLPMIDDGVARYDLLERVNALAEELKNGPLEDSDF